MQLKKNGEKLWKENTEAWLKEPTKRPGQTDETHTPSWWVNNSKKKIGCEMKNCCRTFSIKKRIPLHLRQEHARRPDERINAEAKLNCPVDNCLKSYKTQRWFTRHLKRLPSRAWDGKKIYECLCPGFCKILPTWKGEPRFCEAKVVSDPEGVNGTIVVN